MFLRPLLQLFKGLEPVLGFTLPMLLVLVCFLPLYLCPDPPICLSLPPSPHPTHCADKQPGAMAAEEVTCGIFSGVLFSMLVVLLWGGGGWGAVLVVPLSASHLCCDPIIISHLNFASDVFAVFIQPNLCS